MYLDYFWLYFLTWAFSDCTFWPGFFLTWTFFRHNFFLTVSDLNFFQTVISDLKYVWLYFLTWTFSDLIFFTVLSVLDFADLNFFWPYFLTWTFFSDLNLFFTVLSTVYFLTWTSRQPGASISEPPAEADNVSLQMVQHWRWNDRQTPLPQNLLQLVPHFIGSHQIHQVAEAYLQPHLPNSIASAFLVCIGIGPPLPQLIAFLTFFYVVGCGIFRCLACRVSTCFAQWVLAGEGPLVSHFPWHL